MGTALQEVGISNRVCRRKGGQQGHGRGHCKLESDAIVRRYTVEREPIHRCAKLNNAIPSSGLACMERAIVASDTLLCHVCMRAQARRTLPYLHESASRQACAKCTSEYVQEGACQDMDESACRQVRTKSAHARVLTGRRVPQKLHESARKQASAPGVQGRGCGYLVSWASQALGA